MIVLVLPETTQITGLLVLVATITLPAAWIATGSPRVSYMGFQIAYAAYLCVLQGTEPQFDLTLARDRFIGIVFGNLVHVCRLHPNLRDVVASRTEQGSRRHPEALPIGPKRLGRNAPPCSSVATKSPASAPLVGKIDAELRCLRVREARDTIRSAPCPLLPSDRERFTRRRRGCRRGRGLRIDRP